MAQTVLLSKAPPIRPVQLALALMRGEDLEMPAVIRRNDNELPDLSPEAVIESPLTLVRGHVVPHDLHLPEDLAQICGEVNLNNILAAQAAMGDRSALRECVEVDPALEGLDRLYCQDVVDALIRLHGDVITRL